MKNFANAIYNWVVFTPPINIDNLFLLGLLMAKGGLLSLAIAGFKPKKYPSWSWYVNPWCAGIFIIGCMLILICIALQLYRKREWQRSGIRSPHKFHRRLKEEL